MCRVPPARQESAHPRRHGFHIGQLIHYTLEPNDSGDGREGSHGPPERLTLAFATADVVIVGWQLERVAEHLRDGEPLAVRALPSRYRFVRTPHNRCDVPPNKNGAGGGERLRVYGCVRFRRA